jgi:competence ComEA-like helix-hairpin-helix protein
MTRPLRIWFAVAACLFLCALAASAAGLPDGTGKQVLIKNCSGCHNPDSFTTYAKTKEDWEAVVLRMGPRTPATREELTILADYLAANLPKIEDPTKVNMNKADAKQIESLGFTPQEAEAIVVYRERRGQFRTWGDMLVIYGVDGRKVQAASEKMSF